MSPFSNSKRSPFRRNGGCGSGQRELLLSAKEADRPARSQVSRRGSLLIRSTVLDRFAGVGGLGLGFEQAGFDVAGRLVPIEVKRWASPRPGRVAAVKTLQGCRARSETRNRVPRWSRMRSVGGLTVPDHEDRWAPWHSLEHAGVRAGLDQGSKDAGVATVSRELQRSPTVPTRAQPYAVDRRRRAHERAQELQQE